MARGHHEQKESFEEAVLRMALNSCHEYKNTQQIIHSLNQNIVTLTKEKQKLQETIATLETDNRKFREELEKFELVLSSTS